MSYKCTPNLSRKISAHNKKILGEAQNQNEIEKRECNCSKNNVCPVEGKCLTQEVIYQATVKKSDGLTDTYIGLTSNTLKQRITAHKSNFRTRNPKNATALSRYIWKLQDDKIEHEVSWQIMGRAKKYDPATGVCHLCIKEKYFIIFKPELSTINERDEIAGPCLHKTPQLLKNNK